MGYVLDLAFHRNRLLHADKPVPCLVSHQVLTHHPPPPVPCHKPSVGTFPPETHTCANSIQLMLVMRGW